jgi:hypothetical protein
MHTDPMDSYAAFDFFVTAEHILDWLHPDVPGSTAAKAQREALRRQNRILAITSHIASGAKHFVAQAKHHTAVNDLEQKKGAFDPRAFGPRAFSPEAFSMPGLHIQLDDGAVEHAYTIAEDVLAYWDAALKP